MNWRPAMGPVVAIAVWGVVTYGGLIKPLFLPPPHTVFEALWASLTGGPLIQSLLSTVYRSLVAFGAAALGGLAIGVPLGLWRKTYELCEVTLDFFRTMPSPALIPLATLLFGVGDLSRIVVAAFTCALINAVQTAYAVRGIPRQRVQFYRLAGADKSFLVFRVLVPSALPVVFAGWRLTLSLALIIVVVSEMFVGTTDGLGMLILDYSLMFRTPDMYATIIVVGIVGYLLNKILQLLSDRFTHWVGTT